MEPLKKTSLINLGIAVVAYFLGVYVGHQNENTCFFLCFIFFGLLQTQTVFKYFLEKLETDFSFSYKAEMIIELNIEKFLHHDVVKGNSERERLDIESRKKNNLEKLMSREWFKEYLEKGKNVERFVTPTVSMRFLILNGMFWSDLHKTFREGLSFDYRVFDAEHEEAEEQHKIGISISEGLLQVNWDDIGAWGRNEAVICKFPLFIFRNLSWNRIGIPHDLFEERNEGFRSARKMAAKKGELDVTGVHQLLERYEFKAINHYDRFGSSSFRGDLRDVFSHFENKYMTVRFREIRDDS